MSLVLYVFILPVTFNRGDLHNFASFLFVVIMQYLHFCMKGDTMCRQYPNVGVFALLSAYLFNDFDKVWY
jgi:predicted DNA-binding ribbon-helix-helix protein